MTNRLTEQQLQEELLDEVGDFSRAILRKAGQGIGGVKGAGQKVAGAVTRGAKSLGQAYTQVETVLRKQSLVKIIKHLLQKHKHKVQGF